MRDRSVPLTRCDGAENERLLDVRWAEVTLQIRSVTDDGNLEKLRSVRARGTNAESGHDARSESRDFRSIGSAGRENANDTLDYRRETRYAGRSPG